MVIVNQSAWDGLDAATQEVITTAAANAETACWAKAEELSGWYIEQFKEKGMTVGTLNEAVLGEFQKVGAELRADWVARAGERGQAIIDQMN
jgi:TRAP-type C4-dicarboxylate transport system substrate-binding protein